MERIKEIWNKLESETSAVAGVFKQRYSDTGKCDVYLGLKYPENYRMLILKTPFAIGKKFDFSYEFRGLKFEKAYDPDDSGSVLLNLVLVDTSFKDIFDSLLLDVVNSIISETDIRIIVKNYTSRLVKWQSLFEKFNQQGLSPEEQRGLFGELFFLRKFLNNKSTGFSDVVASWSGPEKGVRDFQSGMWSVEVKTTSGNNHQKISISSAGQLDLSNLEHLFLYHLSLEPRQQSGETLNQIADSVLGILGSDFTALTRFRNKLLAGGYFDHHRQFYESTGYFIRDEDFYSVENDFPRIEEKDVRSGVSDVKYSITTSGYSGFIVPEQEVFQVTDFL